MLSYQDQEKLRSYLTSIVPTREMVDWHVRQNHRGESEYDSKLGWLPIDRKIRHGVGGSTATYSYETDRGRRVVHSRDAACRIHTYGDSFTHGEQVNDGETWQEFLAAHLQEPVRNFGVGGYSVYQAYLRMLQVEPDDGAPYLILNIWADDHFRNLDRWRSARMGGPGQWLVPHLRVDMESRTFEEADLLCPTPEDVYRLADPDWVWEAFRGDPVLRAIRAYRHLDDPSEEDVAWVAEGFGYPEDVYADLMPTVRAKALHREAALFSSRCVVEMAEAFTHAHNRKLMVILSFSKMNLV